MPPTRPLTAGAVGLLADGVARLEAEAARGVKGAYEREKKKSFGSKGLEIRHCS